MDSAATKAMRESARMEEQHAQSCRYLVDRLKADVRFFFSCLEEFVDLPADAAARQRTWDYYVHEVESELQQVVSGDEGAIKVEDIVALLNYKDALMTEMINGLLYQKAVLELDLKSSRKYEGPMDDMWELVQNTSSKTEHVPAKYRMVQLSVFEPGPFTRGVKQQQDAGSALSPMPARLRALLHEMQLLDNGLRNLKFGEQVQIPNHKRGKKEPYAGKKEAYVEGCELRREITYWYKEATRLDKQLQDSKAQRHTAAEEQVKQLQDQGQEKDRIVGDLRAKIQEYEKHEQKLNADVLTLRREKTEVQEKNTKMSKEYQPMLDKLSSVQQQSTEAVSVLTADAELLSSMFRKQVQENRANLEERDRMEEANKKLKGLLKEERTKSEFQEHELLKKETLHMRTVAARKSILEKYHEQKSKIIEVDEMMRSRDADWQEMLTLMQGRDDEIKNLREDVRLANQRIDELEAQKKLCLAEFKKATGRSFNSLLEHFKAPPSKNPQSPR